jgi:hypothetical protein
VDAEAHAISLSLLTEKDRFGMPLEIVCEGSQALCRSGQLSESAAQILL